MRDAVLCYVESGGWGEGGWAFFTTAPLEQQWGDDWNDAPYEHNAGRPYEWREGRDMEPYEIHKVAFDGPLYPPCYGHTNSPWSVEQINAGAVAWLHSPHWSSERVAVPAGTTFTEFCRLVESSGGSVYVPRTEQDTDDA